ncbi:MAG: FeoB small GTPase domain-containing protein, partial [Smithellaceae bacterium]|nr:FeoB small GTPase domain-containing protein [Smithellaceae bacterium]
MEDVNYTLLSLAEGEEAIIYGIAGGQALSSRLASLGLALNAKVRVLQHSGGLVTVQVGDTRIALGRVEAEKIMIRRLTHEASGLALPGRKKLLIALAGQPNVGKSTVFNILTGLSQHVGNWPGKTVEKKEGVHKTEQADMTIVDLPGTYSLTAFSEEEKVARDFILNERPDIVVLLANAAALERSLYLLSELMLLGPPVILALNMIDVAEGQGIKIDVKLLQKVLGVPVVAMVARKNKGIDELLAKIESFQRGEIKYAPCGPDVIKDHREILDALLKLIKGYVKPPYEDRLVATKLMEGDPEISALIREAVPRAVWDEINTLLIEHEDSFHAVVCGRYDWIEAVTRATISRFKRGQVLLTDRIDHVLTKPRYGMPILLSVFALVFALTYAVGIPLQGALQKLVAAFGAGVEN